MNLTKWQWQTSLRVGVDLLDTGERTFVQSISWTSFRSHLSVTSKSWFVTRTISGRSNWSWSDLLAGLDSLTGHVYTCVLKKCMRGSWFEMSWNSLTDHVCLWIPQGAATKNLQMWSRLWGYHPFPSWISIFSLSVPWVHIAFCREKKHFCHQRKTTCIVKKTTCIRIVVVFTQKYMSKPLILRGPLAVVVWSFVVRSWFLHVLLV